MKQEILEMAAYGVKRLKRRTGFNKNYNLYNVLYVSTSGADVNGILRLQLYKGKIKYTKYPYKNIYIMYLFITILGILVESVQRQWAASLTLDYTTAKNHSAPVRTRKALSSIGCRLRQKLTFTKIWDLNLFLNSGNFNPIIVPQAADF